MKSINNQLYCNLCICAVSCNKRFLVDSHKNTLKHQKALGITLKILSFRVRKRFLGSVTPILLKKQPRHNCLLIFLCTSLTIRILKTSFVTLRYRFPSETTCRRTAPQLSEVHFVWHAILEYFSGKP